jgi:hypothetical protein
MGGARFVLLLAVLSVLTLGYLVSSSLSTSPSSGLPAGSGKGGTSWLTRDAFLAYVDGEAILPPDAQDKPENYIGLKKEQVESLEIEPEGEYARVRFVVETGQGRYAVDGTMTLHNIEGRRYLTKFSKWVVTRP